jgi:putative phosphoesterase
MPPKPTRAHVRLRARAGGELTLGVVADTHSQPHPMTRQRLEALAPDAILHAGDIGELSVLEDLAAVAPVHAVRGNIDTRAPGVPDHLILDVLAADAQLDDAAPPPPLLRLLLLHIAVAGPRLRAEVGRLAAAEKASLIVCGHSHVPFIGRDRGVAMFNPGSVGPRRFALPICLGSIIVAQGRARLAHIDCETGLPWSPP